MQRTSIILFLILLCSNVVLAVDELNLVFDANGNLITGDGLFRIYNGFNQLSKVYNGSDDTGMLLEEYLWHPMEDRIHVKREYYSDGSNQTTIYVSKSFVKVINDSGEFDYTYVHHNGQLIAQVNPDRSKHFIHSDHLGSTTAITNESGDVIENSTYTPFGEVLTGGGESKYGYEGKEFDETTNDIDFNARKYKPEWGVFTQPDHIQQNIYDPQTLNRYAFERNNPYKHVDESGNSFTPYHEWGTHAALDDLQDELGLTDQQIAEIADYSKLADEVEWSGTPEEKDAFYEEFGGEYINYHLDPEISDEEKREILEWSMDKFHERLEKGDTKAGVYLHVFGDIIHQNLPPGGGSATWGQRFRHWMGDLNPKNIWTITENIKDAQRHYSNRKGTVGINDLGDFREVRPGVYRKDWTYQGGKYTRVIYR